LNANKDFIYQFDYRRIYDELMTKWFKTNDATTKEILTGRFDIIETGLFSAKQVLANQTEPIFEASVAFPNPTLDGSFTLKINLEKPSEIDIQVSDIQGIIVSQKYPSRLPAGVHTLPLRVGDVPGMYLVNMRSNERQEVLKVVRL
jgi:hypothetical protein